MKKILSFIAGLGLVFALTANVSAETPGINVSQAKQGTELVVTVAADGTLGATIVELEFDAKELSLTEADVKMPENTDYVAYECNVEDGVVSIGFVALKPEHAPKGTIATITFDIAEGAQSKTADQFTIGVKQTDSVTIDELKEIIAGGQGNGGSGNGGNGGSGNGGNTPNQDSDAVKLEQTVIDETVVDIEELLKNNSGDNTKPVMITVDMEKDNGDIATEIPVEILEAIQGENIEVTFDMGEYSWTINGKDVDADELKSINLEVVLDVDVIDEEVIKTVAGEEPTYQITLTHNGEFGFSATLTFNLDKAYNGQYGNLYLFTNGKLVLQQAALIAENGDVSFEFEHASDYVIVVGENAEDAGDSNEGEEEKPSDDEADKNEDKTPVDDSVEKKTPWGMILGITAVVVVVAAVGVFVFMRRK